MTQLQKEKDDLLQLDILIRKTESEINDTSDIVTRNQKEEILSQMHKRREDIVENKPVYDYFFETGEILYKYYDLQSKIQSGHVTSSAPTRAKPGSVLAALQEGDMDFTMAPVAKTGSLSKSEGRDVLLEKYLQKIDPEHARNVTLVEDPYGSCEKCDQEMTFSTNEALFFCSGCGFQEFVLIDSDKPSYKDPPREVTYYAYKRINHFNEWLAQFQAKESTEIPEDIFQAILEELKKERITDASSIKPSKVREILKKLKCTNFYEHVPYILNRINGKTAPVMSREIEEKLRFMFKEIQSSFVKHKGKAY